VQGLPKRVGALLEVDGCHRGGYAEGAFLDQNIKPRWESHEMPTDQGVNRNGDCSEKGVCGLHSKRERAMSKAR